MVASCAALRAAARLVLTFSPEAGTLFAEGFGEVTSECVSAEKEVLLITFFFSHPAGRTGTICHLRRFGSEAYRRRLCSGLWLFLRSGPERRIWNSCTGHHLLRCMSVPLASTCRGSRAYLTPVASCGTLSSANSTFASSWRDRISVPGSKRLSSLLFFPAQAHRSPDVYQAPPPWFQGKGYRRFSNCCCNSLCSGSATASVRP